MTTRILYVDDDAIFLELVSDLFKRAGVEVTACRDMLEAKTLLAKERFDVVLTDYLMVNGSGGTLSHYCQSEGHPCIVVSGHFAADILPHVAPGVPVVNKLELLADDGGQILQHIRMLPRGRSAAALGVRR